MLRSTGLSALTEFVKLLRLISSPLGAVVEGLDSLSQADPGWIWALALASSVGQRLIPTRKTPMQMAYEGMRFVLTQGFATSEVKM